MSRTLLVCLFFLTSCVTTHPDDAALYGVPNEILIPTFGKNIYIGDNLDCNAQQDGVWRYASDKSLRKCQDGVWRVLTIVSEGP